MILRSLSLFVGVLLFSIVTSCGDPAPSTSSTTEPTSSERSIDDQTPEEPVEPSLAAPDCTVEGEVLDGNRVWLPSADVLAVIKAGEATEGYGPSHRTLQLLDGRSCETKFETTLPDNSSPDYPYYIAEVQYNTLSNLIGIRGFYKVLICDMDNDYAISALDPEYFTEREYDDSQTGMVQRLEVWEDYLLGYAQDCGPFAFDLSDATNPKAVIPFAEWQNAEDGAFHSLFLLPTEGGVQGILPSFDPEEDAFTLHPLFEAPMTVSQQVQESARNNKFLVLRQTDPDRTPVAINLATRELMNLPDNLIKSSTQDILSWMRGQ
ncbi:MAG: hypothetical protein AAFY48_12335 [Bacteroidota bacterium]